MSLWAAFLRTYSQSWRFLVTLPIIAVAVIGVEGLQHAVEWAIGMYRDIASAKAVQNSPARMLAGSLKVGWLLIVQFWVARFIVSGGSAAATLELEPVAIRKFSWFFVYYFVVTLVILFLPNVFALGVRRTMSIVVELLALLLIPIGVTLSPWSVGAANGDPRASPMFALRRSAGSVLWGLALTFLTMLPLMVFHYGLNCAAIGRSPGLAILMLAADAVCIGFLGIVINAAPVPIAERMARRTGDDIECRRTRSALAT